MVGRAFSPEVVSAIPAASRRAAIGSGRNCPKVALVYSIGDASLRDYLTGLLGKGMIIPYAAEVREFDAESPGFPEAGAIAVLLSHKLIVELRAQGLRAEEFLARPAFRNRACYVIACDPEARGVSLPEGIVALRPRDGGEGGNGRGARERDGALQECLRTAATALIREFRFQEVYRIRAVYKGDRLRSCPTQMAIRRAKAGPPVVFISYSSRDVEEIKTVRKYLAGLELQNKIAIWSDDRLHAGDNWKQRIEDEIRRARIILMLLSVNYLASTAIQTWEIKCIKARWSMGEAVVIPIIAHECPHQTQLPKWASKIEHRPREGTVWPGSDDHVASRLTEICNELAKIAEELARRRVA